MASTVRSRTSLRRAVVLEVLRSALDERSASGLDVLDAGGGSGGFAVPLAQLGHRVTVLDPSPNSLAALERRAAEAEVSALVSGVQGELSDLDAPGGSPASYDLVLCHSVLEVVDDPAAALVSVAGVLRPGGMVSVLAANRTAAVLARAVAGHIAEANRLLTDPAGRSGHDDALARRFSLNELLDLISGAGLRPARVHGIRVFTDLVPGQVLDADPLAGEALVQLEYEAAHRREFFELATQLHVLAVQA